MTIIMIYKNKNKKEMWLDMHNRSKGIQIELSYITFPVTMMNIYFHSQRSVIEWHAADTKIEEKISIMAVNCRYH
jgi:hypothetical protein